jgi:predicted glycosyl hydrolase (DUF1957 family)
LYDTIIETICQIQGTDWPTSRRSLECYNRLAELVEAGQADPDLVEELYERDKLFPNMDYRWFRDRERGG